MQNVKESANEIKIMGKKQNAELVTATYDKTE